MAKGIKNVFIESDSVGVLGTKIYRDDILIATVPVGTTFYNDPTAIEGVQYKYVNQAYTSTSESTDEVEGVNMDYYTIATETTLTPVMTNFRTKEGDIDRVYFDTPLGPVTGLTKQGFTISGVSEVMTINAVDNYFTVDTGLDHWDNNTIRLEGGDGTVHDFTLEHIINEMDEPTATDEILYVTHDASGGNGTEGSPYTFIEAYTQASAGTTVWCKAGDYGDIEMIFTKVGDVDNPVKFIGYKNEIDDIEGNYYDNGVAYDTDEMPSFSNNTGANYAFEFQNTRYLIFRNFQFSGGACNLDWENDTFFDHSMLENINVLTSIRARGIAFFNDYSTANLHRIRLKGCVVKDQGTTNILLRGQGFNLIDSCKSYSTVTSNAPDYLVGVGGSNSIIKNCIANATANPDSSIHALFVRNAYLPESEYNLIYDSSALNTQHTLDIRNSGASNNVIKDCSVVGTTASQRGGIDFNGCGDNNIVERCYIKDVRQGIEIREDALEGSDGTGIGVNNQVRNCIFDNVSEGAVYTSGDSGGTVSFDDFKIYNNTFNDCAYFTSEGNTVALSNFLVKNNIFKDVVSNGNSGGSASNFIFDYNSFSGCWTTGIGVNDIEADPEFADEIDFLPTNEDLYMDAVTGIYYDYNKKERTSLESTAGSVTLTSENAGEQPIVVPDYYVSADGTGDGLSESTPMSYASLQALNPVAGEVVGLKGGDKFFGRLSLSDKNSGTNGAPITYTSYGSGQAEITGMELLSGWVQNGNIWEADVLGKTVYQVAVSDDLVMNARFPDITNILDSEANYTSIDTVTDQTHLIVDSLAGFTDLEGAKVYISTVDYHIEQRTITEYDNSTGAITIDPPTDLEVEVGNRVFVNNHYNLLSAQNEWHYDSVADKVYIYSSSIPANIYINTVDTDALTCSRMSYYTFDNLKLNGFNQSGFRWSTSDNIVMTNNTILNCRTAGILAFSSGDYNANNNTIKGCLFRALYVDGSGTGDVQYNAISEIGLLNMWTYTEQPNKNTPSILTESDAIIKNNTITNVGYHGVSPRSGVAVVENNKTQNTCLTLDDGGAIYFGDVSSTGSNASNNICIDNPVSSANWASQGLYSDENSTGLTFEENTVIGFQYNIQIHLAAGSSWLNNNLYNPKKENLNTGDKIDSADVLNHIITNNDMYSDLSTTQIGISNFDGDNYDIGTIDYNNYYNPNSSNLIHILTGNTDQSYVLAGWQALLPDENQNSTDNTGLTITDSQVVYNDTGTQAVIPLTGTWYDMSGNQYVDSITLAAWSGEILIQHN